jgi:hypothetical protein
MPTNHPAIPHRKHALSVPVTLPPVLREFCWVTLLLTLISGLYCITMVVVFHKHYPYNWPFFLRSERFSDFTIFTHKFEYFHQAAFFTTGFPINYPAPMTIVYEAFFKFAGSKALLAFLIVLLLSFAVPAVLFGRALVKRGLSRSTATVVVSITLLLSWPALLLVDRANVEVIVWIAVALGAWAYARNKGWTAAAMFGVAASLKLFPFIYLALFLTRKNFPKVLFGALVFGGVTLASLAMLGPTIPVAYQGLAMGMSSFRANYMVMYRPAEGGFDHSVLAFCKLWIAIALRDHSAHALLVALNIYLPLMAIGGILLYFLLIRKLPLLNQLLVLTIASIYFTPFSGDGTLIHLYCSFALCSFLAIDAWKRKIEIPGLRTIFLCYAWLFSIESFLIVIGYRVEGQFKCVGIAVLLISALRHPLGPPLKSNQEEDLSWPNASHIQTARILPDNVS